MYERIKYAQLKESGSIQYFFPTKKSQFQKAKFQIWLKNQRKYPFESVWKPDRFPDLAHSYYGCYFYGEGRYFFEHEKLDRLAGHPVLYVPGSGGSYKQARNVGSVLYQKMKGNRVAD